MIGRPTNDRPVARANNATAPMWFTPLWRASPKTREDSAAMRRTLDNTLGLRCARFARWPPQARERGSSGKASDTASPGCRRALAAS